MLNVEANDIDDSDTEEKLETLGYSVNYNAISDFSVVSELPSLKNLMLGGNPVEDMAPLETAKENGVSISGL